MSRAPSYVRSTADGVTSCAPMRVLAIALLWAAVTAACGVAQRPEAPVSAGDVPPGAPLPAPTSAPPGGPMPTSSPPERLVADRDGDGVVRIVLWGDSLAFEAREAFLLTLAAWPEIDTETRTLGGVAICDYLDEISARASEVEVALLEFSGNSMWTCMVDPTTGLAPRGRDLVARYEADLTTAVRALRGAGARVVLLGAPPAGFEPPGGERELVRAMFERFAAANDGVSFVDAGAVLLEDGRYTDTLPCLPFEDASLGCDPDGRIVVRSPDQLHLCPNDHPPDPFVGRCDVWPSGAHRYGLVMAEAALLAAGVGPVG